MTASPYRDVYIVTVIPWLLTLIGIVVAFITGDSSMAMGCAIGALITTVIVTVILMGTKDKQ